MAHILVCDDDPGVRDLLSLTLQLDHKVTVVESGVQALQYLADSGGAADVLLLDVMMPDLDGFDTLRRIRTSAVTADLPVIMLTARVGEDDYVRGYETGADAYLSKPFDPADLDEAIETVLKRSPAERKTAREEERARARLLRQLEDRFH
ncbi:MAG: response regulator transcription factor [Actinobacteria bacterium]|nr:response regulator transcription factor [Actinomycetota bacterium]